MRYPAARYIRIHLVNGKLNVFISVHTRQPETERFGRLKVSVATPIVQTTALVKNLIPNKLSITGRRYKARMRGCVYRCTDISDAFRNPQTAGE